MAESGCRKPGQVVLMSQTRHVRAPEPNEQPRRRRLRPTELLGILIAVLGLSFLGFEIASNWSEFSDSMSSADPFWFAGALALGLASMTTIGWNWRRILTLVGANPGPTSQSLHQYFVGQLGKYVPGGVWPVVGRAEMATRAGLSRKHTYAATLLSLTYTYLAALVTAAGFAVAGWLNGGPALFAWLGVGVVIVASSVVHPGVAGLVAALARRLARREIDFAPLEWKISVREVIAHVPAWVGISAATTLVALSLGHSGSLFEIGLATCVAWFSGFVIIGLPGGLGVREAVFVALLPSGPLGVAAGIALVARLVFVAVDVIGAGVSSGLAGLRSAKHR